MLRKSLLIAVGAAAVVSGVVSLGGDVLAVERDSSENTAEAAQAICRQLAWGDPYFPRWNYCCDVDNGARSRWTSPLGFEGVWDGGCASWGIKP